MAVNGGGGRRGGECRSRNGVWVSFCRVFYRSIGGTLEGPPIRHGNGPRCLSQPGGGGFPDSLTWCGKGKYLAPWVNGGHLVARGKAPQEGRPSFLWQKKEIPRFLRTKYAPLLGTTSGESSTLWRRDKLSSLLEERKGGFPASGKRGEVPLLVATVGRFPPWGKGRSPQSCVNRRLSYLVITGEVSHFMFMRAVSPPCFYPGLCVQKRTTPQPSLFLRSVVPFEGILRPCASYCSKYLPWRVNPVVRHQ